MKMEWFQPQEGGVYIEDFDYLLKLAKISAKALTLTDLAGNTFTMKFNTEGADISVGDIIKLRSIASINDAAGDNKTIQTSKYTTVLTVPEYFRDWKVFNDPEYDPKSHLDVETEKEPAFKIPKAGFNPASVEPLRFGKTAFNTDPELSDFGMDREELFSKISKVWAGFDKSGY